jgi:hypothetical protein
MGGGLDSRCVGRVYGTDVAVITLLHRVGNSNYFMKELHGQTTLNFPLKGHVVIIQRVTHVLYRTVEV